jgi:hypothetical protein
LLLHFLVHLHDVIVGGTLARLTEAQIDGRFIIVVAVAVVVIGGVDERGGGGGEAARRGAAGECRNLWGRAKTCKGVE